MCVNSLYIKIYKRFDKMSGRSKLWKCNQRCLKNKLRRVGGAQDPRSALSERSEEQRRDSHYTVQLIKKALFWGPFLLMAGMPGSSRLRSSFPSDRLTPYAAFPRSFGTRSDSALHYFYITFGLAQRSRHPIGHFVLACLRPLTQSS